MEWLTGWFTWPSNLSPQRRRIAYWVIHVFVVLLVVAALAALNYWTGLERVLRTRTLNLHRIWLPVLFLLGYALFWLIRWLYWLLGPEGRAGEFDDIELAWADARRQLEQAGMVPADAPLFLVLGRPGGSLESTFAATRLSFQVRHAPGHGAPLHVYASREAIFVTCEAASLLPVQVDRLLQVDQPAPQPASLLEGIASTPEYLEMEPAAAEAGSSPAPAVLLAPAPARAVLLLGEKVPSPDAPARKRRPSLLRDLEAVDLQTRRLRHVCRLLLRDRRPYCPVNGILALVPMVATATPEDATETAEVLRHDFDVTRSALQLDCPRFVVLCDAEQLPGFAELARNFPEGSTGPSWVLGQHYPILPDVPPAQVAEMIESGLAWVADTLLPVVVGSLWRREGEGGAADRRVAVEANMRLYSFLDACRQRLLLLARLAGRAVRAEDGPPLLGGCYLAGTGPDGDRDQAFLAGVVRHALQQQNSVRWTREALADDAAYAWYTRVGYGLLAAFAVVVVAMLWAWW